MCFRIEISDSSTAQVIEQELLRTLHQSLEQAENRQFVLAAKSDEDTLLGGLTGSTSYGWLLIKTLWVDKNQRRKGLGMSLMEQAESRGQELGCHSAWLDTSNPTSKIFYEALGYKVFSELKNTAQQVPSSHQRWFMKKNLQASM